jgi:hypothetical protein
VGDLDQDAGAVAGFRVAPAGSAMGQVDQDLDALEDDVVRLVALDVGHETDAAGVPFVGGMIEALGCRETRRVMIIDFHGFIEGARRARRVLGISIRDPWNISLVNSFSFAK